ncbi:hypothetical protein RRG08_012770 [Elysia crispata]|uniref:Uncharacterized protein n=1 Tax=Elysia crispata TaxID=231223 RepID=A0AAE0YTB6_9GAST|nr:hypothetical protein RRG08_012770 [Elysia crispata]
MMLADPGGNSSQDPQLKVSQLELSHCCSPTKPQQHLEGRSDIAKDQRNQTLKTSCLSSLIKRLYENIYTKKVSQLELTHCCSPTKPQQHLEGRSDIAKDQGNLAMLPTKPQQHLEGRSDIAKDQRNLVMLEMTLIWYDNICIFQA